MLGFKGNKRPAETAEDTDASAAKRGFFGSLKERMRKTRDNLTEGLAELFQGKRAIDDELLEELESRLLTADVGMPATQRIMSELTGRVSRQELNDASALYQSLRELLVATLQPCVQPLSIPPAPRPYVILIVGVNGNGKTTSIGKIAHHLQDAGHGVMLAAADTFRAAAVEQLQTWGQRAEVPVIAQGQGADPAAVCHDAYEAARARGIDVLVADTAGRLHTQDHLMEELRKIRRVLGKRDSEAPHEVLLVIDGTSGQNALRQAEAFREVTDVSGLIVTKLDGTAKGGVVVALAEQLRLPIRYIGVGEGIEDLRPFAAEEFVDALLALDE
jgi:fused signal recognition particle receptor